MRGNKMKGSHRIWGYITINNSSQLMLVEITLKIYFGLNIVLPIFNKIRY